MLFDDILNLILLNIILKTFNRILNISSRKIIQIHHSMLELLFQAYCSNTVFIYFCNCNKKVSFEEQHVYSNFLYLILENKFIWFIRFAVFCVHEYCFHACILRIIVQSCFFIVL